VKYYSSDKMGENEMGRASGMHGGKEKCTAFSGLNPKE
jgi:hypothetical protein